MRSSHVSEQLSYISHAGIPYAFGFRGQCSMYKSIFGQVQDSFQALVLCVSNVVKCNLT